MLLNILDSACFATGFVSKIKHTVVAFEKNTFSLNHKIPGQSFTKLGNLGDILKICISGTIFPFHKGIKYILEHLFD